MIIDFIQTVDDCKREEKDPEGIFKLEVDNKLTIMAWLQQKKDKTTLQKKSIKKTTWKTVELEPHQKLVVISGAQER